MNGECFVCSFEPTTRSTSFSFDFSCMCGIEWLGGLSLPRPPFTGIGTHLDYRAFRLPWFGLVRVYCTKIELWTFRWPLKVVWLQYIVLIFFATTSKDAIESIEVSKEGFKNVIRIRTDAFINVVQFVPSKQMALKWQLARMPSIAWARTGSKRWLVFDRQTVFKWYGL